MTRHTTVPLVTRVGCDKRKCDVTIATPHLKEWDERLPEFLRAAGWSRWVGRSSYDYCPDHGPGRQARARQHYDGRTQTHYPALRQLY